MQRPLNPFSKMHFSDLPIQRGKVDESGACMYVAYTLLCTEFVVTFSIRAEHFNTAGHWNRRKHEPCLVEALRNALVASAQHHARDTQKLMFPFSCAVPFHVQHFLCDSQDRGNPFKHSLPQRFLHISLPFPSLTAPAKLPRRMTLGP